MKRGEDSLEAASGSRRVRTDVRRNLDALLEAAKAIFASDGVDAPVRDIADKAGVGVATLYRHFPQRADLIAAVFRREIDACANEAADLAAAYPPGEALSRWIDRYADFIAAKRGLAPALHSGDPTYEPLRGYFQAKLNPALKMLLDAAYGAGEIRADADADELLIAVASLCMASYTTDPGQARRMIGLLLDGLRFRAN